MIHSGTEDGSSTGLKFGVQDVCISITAWAHHAFGKIFTCTNGLFSGLSFRIIALKKWLLFSHHLQCEEIQNGLNMLDMAMGRWIMNSIVAQFTF